MGFVCFPGSFFIPQGREGRAGPEAWGQGEGQQAAGSWELRSGSVLGVHWRCEALQESEAGARWVLSWDAYSSSSSCPTLPQLQELLHHYYPIEIDPNRTLEEKRPLMVEW